MARDGDSRPPCQCGPSTGQSAMCYRAIQQSGNEVTPPTVTHRGAIERLQQYQYSLPPQ